MRMACLSRLRLRFSFLSLSQKHRSDTTHPLAAYPDG
jgi:hypothetical protein